MSVPTHPLPHIEDDQLWALFALAEDIGLRLEVTETGHYLGGDAGTEASALNA